MEDAYGTWAWLSRKLETSYQPISIRIYKNILDLALGGFLESARSRTFRSGPTRPAAEPGESDVTGPPAFGASGRQRTNPNEEPTETVLPQGGTPARSPA